MEKFNPNNSPHILVTASNLLGFSLLAMTSLKSFGLAGATMLDEILGICMVACAVSTLLSFISMRTASVEKSNRYELAADIIFFSTLLVLTASAVLLMVDITNFSK